MALVVSRLLDPDYASCRYHQRENGTTTVAGYIACVELSRPAVSGFKITPFDVCHDSDSLFSSRVDAVYGGYLAAI